jgi:hypothetical protein
MVDMKKECIAIEWFFKTAQRVGVKALHQLLCVCLLTKINHQHDRQGMVDGKKLLQHLSRFAVALGKVEQNQCHLTPRALLGGKGWLYPRSTTGPHYLPALAAQNKAKRVCQTGIWLHKQANALVVQ